MLCVLLLAGGASGRLPSDCLLAALALLVCPAALGTITEHFRYS